VRLRHDANDSNNQENRNRYERKPCPNPETPYRLNLPRTTQYNAFVANRTGPIAFKLLGTRFPLGSARSQCRSRISADYTMSRSANQPTGRLAPPAIVGAGMETITIPYRRIDNNPYADQLVPYQEREIGASTIHSHASCTRATVPWLIQVSVAEPHATTRLGVHG
jgi:hypothetical protein